MHKLARQVRFSINPFLPKEKAGFNSFASDPPGDGLALYFGLWVELLGEADETTGFVVDVRDIDSAVRQHVVPIFSERIKSDFRKQKHLSLLALAELLKLSWQKLGDKFTPARLSRLTLELNPFRKIGIDSEDYQMVYFSEKFEFAATHKLWNEGFSDEKNFAVFGKCANPTGHGHNYVVEVTIKVPRHESALAIGDFEKIVDDTFVKLVDHKNLNVDIPEFAKLNPTVENIAVFAWKKLQNQFSQAQLHCVTVWETEKTYCCYSGQ